MIRRCHWPKDKNFANYGGRGIHVCPEWRGAGGYARFIRDIGRRPSTEHSIERLDNNVGYQPGNVTWATRTEQSRNRRNVARYNVRGMQLCVPEIAEALGVAPSSIHYRLGKGMVMSAILEELAA